MYYLNPQLGQPGQGKSVYLFAHARTGMFLPLLTASKVSNGKKMLGMIVEVWTADDQRFLYVITDVYRHQPFDHVFDKPFAATERDALAPDVGGRRDPAEAAHQGRAAVAGGGAARRGAPEGQAARLLLSVRRRPAPPAPPRARG